MIRRLLNRFRQTPVLASRDAYRRWAKTYPPVAHNPFMQLEEMTMRELLPPLAGLHVLDLACGTGRWGRVALDMGAQQVISFDDSEAMLIAGRPENAALASMDAIPLRSGCMEVVLCGLAIGHLDRAAMRNAIAEIGRVLVPGGTALISDVHPFRAWMGAQRTFLADGKTFAVTHTIHSYADYHTAAVASGLTIAAIKEGTLDSNTPPTLLVLKLIKSPSQPGSAPLR